MLPKAIGAITYADPSAIETECSDFRAALEEAGGTYAEPFLTAPSPGIIASIVQNEHYDSFETYLDALSVALQIEYEGIVRHGFLLQLDCPDLALERHTSYRDRPLGDFVGFVELVIGRSTRRCRTFRGTKCVCMCAGGTTKALMTATYPWPTFSPSSSRQMSGPLFCPLRTPATRTSTAY
jgi:hypothetical protein